MRYQEGRCITAARISLPIIHKPTTITIIHVMLAKNWITISVSLNIQDTTQLLPFQAAWPIIASEIPISGDLGKLQTLS